MKNQFKKGAIITGASLLGIFLIWFSFNYWASYSSGIRAGVVTKVSNKGVFFKTYEGELHTSELEKWAFSVERSDTEIIEKLNSVALSKERVSLHYVERFRTFPWRGETVYFITQVEKLGDSSNQAAEAQSPHSAQH